MVASGALIAAGAAIPPAAPAALAAAQAVLVGTGIVGGVASSGLLARNTLHPDAKDDLERRNGHRRVKKHYRVEAEQGVARANLKAVEKAVKSSGLDGHDQDGALIMALNGKTQENGKVLSIDTPGMADYLSKRLGSIRKAEQSAEVEAAKGSKLEATCSRLAGYRKAQSTSAP